MAPPWGRQQDQGERGREHGGGQDDHQTLAEQAPQHPCERAAAGPQQPELGGAPVGVERGGQEQHPRGDARDPGGADLAERQCGLLTGVRAGQHAAQQRGGVQVRAAGHAAEEHGVGPGDEGAEGGAGPVELVRAQRTGVDGQPPEVLDRPAPGRQRAQAPAVEEAGGLQEVVAVGPCLEAGAVRAAEFLPERVPRVVDAVEAGHHAGQRLACHVGTVVDAVAELDADGLCGLLAHHDRQRGAGVDGARPGPLDQGHPVGEALEVDEGEARRGVVADPGVVRVVHVAVARAAGTVGLTGRGQRQLLADLLQEHLLDGVQGGAGVLRSGLGRGLQAGGGEAPVAHEVPQGRVRAPVRQAGEGRRQEDRDEREGRHEHGRERVRAQPGADPSCGPVAGAVVGTAVGAVRGHGGVGLGGHISSTRRSREATFRPRRPMRKADSSGTTAIASVSSST